MIAYLDKNSFKGQLSIEWSIWKKLLKYKAKTLKHLILMLLGEVSKFSDKAPFK